MGGAIWAAEKGRRSTRYPAYRGGTFSHARSLAIARGRVDGVVVPQGLTLASPEPFPRAMARVPGRKVTQSFGTGNAASEEQRAAMFYPKPLGVDDSSLRPPDQEGGVGKGMVPGSVVPDVLERR